MFSVQSSVDWDSLSNSHNPLFVRQGAAVGLMQVGTNRHLYNEAARQRAVNALCEAVQHDSWEPARSTAAKALTTFGDKRAIPALERAAEAELDDGVKRAMRVTTHTLRTSDKSDEQYKQLRKDLDEMREENRSLREKLVALEARLQ